MRTTDLAEMLRGLGRSNLQKCINEIAYEENDSDPILSKQKTSKKKKTIDDIDGRPDQVIINPSLNSIDNRR
jgi:hypothetical protein